jgi:16S rRNA G966 N2-methylase RsmD
MIAAPIRHNNARMGFYPTDILSLKAICDSIEFKDKVTMLDPCCGEGVALETIGNGLHHTIGVELNDDRYYQARDRLNVCLHSDALMQTKYSPSKLDFLFLNPPYGDSAISERLEYAFVKRYSQSLASGGLMVLLIPSTQVNEKFLKYLMSNFEMKTAGLAPVSQYKQWIFIGSKVRRRTPTKTVINDVLETIKIDFEAPLIPIVCKSFNEIFTISTSKVTQEQITYAIEGKPSLWDAYFDSQIISKDTVNNQPLIELTDWYITMGILGGHISGFLDNGDMKVLLRGKVHKEFGEAVYGNGNKQENYTQTEVFVPKILALNVKQDSDEFGEIYEIK